MLPRMGQTFRKESYKVFSYFLYFTKSRKKPAAGRRKDLSLFVRSFCLCVLIRGLQNLESPCKEVRIVTFCVVQKVTKKHVLGRAKSCRWQVFVRRRPPKQGELRTDVSKATMIQGDRAAKDLILFVRNFGFVR